ncbi:MAG: lytic transglycosylase domain-containing protein, partial [Polyangiaceae bacterium]|nr:lytic transglycosylase domain-containing protein [Polyangiaceae bacterium]
PDQLAYHHPDFERAAALLRVGDIKRGEALLAGLESDESLDDTLLWGLALLYDRSGDVHLAHRIARGRLSDWFARYPSGEWLKAWQIAFPRPYLMSVSRQVEKTGVPPWFIYGVMREESTFDARVVSHANAYGLMQVIPPTARGIGKKYQLRHSRSALKIPQDNIALGAHILKDLSRQFAKNPTLAIPGYNAGPGRPRRWLRERPDMDFDLWVEAIPYRETRRYMKRVLASRAAYAFIYYPEQAEQALLLPLHFQTN